MKIDGINKKYFGKDSDKRYLIEAFQNCANNIVSVEVISRLLDKIYEKHECPNANQNVIADCAYCQAVARMIDAYFDALYLNARLLFERKATAMVSDFLKDVDGIEEGCLSDYYLKKYDYKFDDMDSLSKLKSLAVDVSKKAKKDYRVIEEYQNYKFHTPEDQVIANVEVKTEDRGWIKFNQIIKKSKYKNSTKEILEMLVSLADVIDKYVHLVSFPKRYRKVSAASILYGIVQLFSIDMAEDKKEEMLKDINKHIEPINMMLKCNTGREQHNKLILFRLTSETL